MEEALQESLLICSRLLRYPDSELLGSLEEIRGALGAVPQSVKSRIEQFLDYVEGADPITLQETYVSTFDLNGENTLYFTYPLYGDDAERGTALLELKQIYRAAGFAPTTDELPDYLPLFLEFVALSESRAARPIISRCLPQIAEAAKRLRDAGNPYAPVLEACALCLEAFGGG